MGKIGILIFTDQIKKRGTRKDNYFESSEYTGLKYIISEIDRSKYDVQYTASCNLKDFDFALVTIISFMDIYNLVNELKGVDKGKCKIIVGGPGIWNIRPIINYIDIAIWRRGENIINRVFEMDYTLKNVWFKDNDPKFNNKYYIGEQSKWIGEEKQVGCQKKCFFCQYSWTNKYSNISDSKDYEGGYNEFETFFVDTDWELCRKTAVTAIDGAEEKTRSVINKPISRQEITEKMLQAHQIKTDKRLSLKIYNIIGYSWENEKTALFQEFVEDVSKADGMSENKIIITVHLSHFSPMANTPMYFEKINLINYRALTREDYILYEGKNFKVYLGMYATTPAQVVETQTIERSWDSELFEKVLLSKKYNAMNVAEKTKLYKSKMFQNIIREYDLKEEMPTDNIIIPYEYRKTSEIYKQRRVNNFGI